MKKLKQILLLIICFLLLCSFNAFADEYDDYTVKVPLLQTVHMSKDVTSTERIFFNIKNLGIDGDHVAEFQDSSTGNYGDMGPMMTFRIGETDNLKSAKLKIYAALHSESNTGYVGTSISGSTAVTLRQYSFADIPIWENTSPEGESLVEYDSAARATYANFYQAMTGYGNTSVVIRSNEILQYGNWADSETYLMSIDLDSISLAENSYFTVVVGSPTNTYYSAENADKLPYIELVYDNEPLREEAAREAVEALLPYDSENSINGENIEEVEELLADAKQKIARLRSETLKDELTETVISVEARMNTFYIEYKRENFNSVDGADISAELEYELDFTQESDFFVKAEAVISDSIGEKYAEITVGDTKIGLKADGVYLNEEKAAEIVSGKNTFALRFSGTSSRSVELFVNGISVIKKDNQSLDTVSEILAQSTDSEKLLINGITVETCPSGFGSEAEEALNEFKELLNNSESEFEDVLDMYSQVYSATAAMSESIFSAQINLAADNLIGTRLVTERVSAEEEKNYNALVDIYSIWDEISDNSLKSAERTEIETILAEYDGVAPIVKNVEIIKLSKTQYKASYVIEDSIIREEAEPLIQWYVNDRCVLENEEVFDISAYAGYSVTVSVTPLNNKGYAGASLCSEPVAVPYVDDDFTEKITVKRRFSRSFNKETGVLTGIIADRAYASDGIKSYPFNDGGYYLEGQQFEFEMGDIPLEALKSAKLVVHAASRECYVYLKGFVNTENMPAELGTMNGWAIADATVLEALNEVFDNMNEASIESDKKIDKAATPANPTMLEFDLLQKDDEGNYIISFETGKDIILNIQGPAGDQIVTLALNDEYMPYLLLDVDMEPVRIKNAEAAVNELLPYVSNKEITSENLNEVENLLDIAQNKISRIADSEIKNKLLATVSSVEKKKNLFTISASRQEISAADGKNITALLTETVSLTDNDLFIKVDFNINQALEENELIEIKADNEINAKITSEGIYLQGEKVAEPFTGKAELLLRNSTGNSGSYTELYLNGVFLGKAEGLVLNTAETVAVINNTVESVTTDSMTIEVCPKGYGNTPYGLLGEADKALTKDTELNKAISIYNETQSSIEGMGDSLYSDLISESFGNVIDKYVTNMLENYITEQKYKEFVSYKSFISNIKNGILRESLLKKYYEIETLFDKLTPEVLYAGIDEDSKYVLKAAYTVKDSVGNAKITDGKEAVLFEWILDTGKVVGTDSTIDVSDYKGHKIILSVTPLNNKNVKGEAAKSIAFSIKSTSSAIASGGGGGGGGSVYEAVYTPSSVGANLPANSFNDISSSWARNEITALKEKNIINGDEKGNFNPDNNVTRAEFVAMLDRAGKIPSVNAESEFSDVGVNDWFYRNVKKAVSSGVVTGSNGAFYPNKAITRQEMAIILSRITEGSTNSDITNIKDYHNISEWAKEGVSEVVALSVMKGDPDGSFRPLDLVTRAEAAAVIYRIIQ